MVKQTRRKILLAAGAAALAGSARGQQSARVRRIGVLMPFPESDAESRQQMSVLEQGLREAGWTAGRVAIDYRWTGGDPARMKVMAKELVALSPDLLVARGTPVVLALMGFTRSIPIVFVSVADPVGDRLVASLPRPGGNVTGFTNFEASMGGKWVQLLKEVAPALARAGFLFNPDTAPGGGGFFMGSFQAGARSLGVEPGALPARTPEEIEAAGAALAREPRGGLIVMPDTSMLRNKDLITAMALRQRLPAIYPFRYYVVSGGLISYGTDLGDLYRRAVSYIDRVLRGEQPADLPVQAPTKFELVINQRTARALRLAVPRAVLLRADEVID